MGARLAAHFQLLRWISLISVIVLVNVDAHAALYITCKSVM